MAYINTFACFSLLIAKGGYIYSLEREIHCLVSLSFGMFVCMYVYVCKFVSFRSCPLIYKGLGFPCKVTIDETEVIFEFTVKMNSFLPSFPDYRRATGSSV